MVRLEQLQAVLDPLTDVFRRVDVLALLAADDAAALRSQEVLIAAVRDVLADELLATSVVDRRVDEVDPVVEHGVENHLRLLVRDLGAARATAQLHRTEAENCHVCARLTQSAFR